MEGQTQQMRHILIHPLHIPAQFLAKQRYGRDGRRPNNRPKARTQTFRQILRHRLRKIQGGIQERNQHIKRLQSHLHIIRVFGSYTCGRELGMLLIPIANGGDLRAYLQDIKDSDTPITEKQYSVLNHSFGCLASGLAFIHKHTIRHKDIKPKSILIHNDRVIYTDFGISYDASQQNTTTTGKPEALTMRYCAPEVANWEKRNRKSDVFSLGCVFIEILAVLEPNIDLGVSNSDPYWEMVDHIRKALIYLSTSDSGRDQVFRACHSMLEPRSADRIGAEALLHRLLDIQSSHPDPVYELFCNDCAPRRKDEGTTAATGQRLDLSREDDHPLEESSVEESSPEESSPEESSLEESSPEESSPEESSPEESSPKESSLEENEPLHTNRAFSPLQGNAFSSLSTQAAIRQVMEKPLTKIELPKMYLFIVWSLGNFGFIRIGVTVNVPRRLKNWEKQCKHHVREYMQHAQGKRLLVKYARRVEQLVFAELKDVRFQENPCEGCHMKHVEWFRTTPEHAAKVIKKFSDWTARDPYEFDQTSNRWRLGEQTSVHEMEMLCQPIVLEPW
ncbi:kinase-like protein [Lindgomyces ingoldianus]|uniref:Kinase-like protein n=1 Tax=Lindgomyces ingoldianus TaxID=673940 RepID=A0ACB6QC48_9PLEO|nr:kinase-like protein [Lindgomyces ingoldianus]KAF2464471.1 kinase-like protein [Lindgomyces ingoldianus]